MENQRNEISSIRSVAGLESVGVSVLMVGCMSVERCGQIPGGQESACIPLVFNLFLACGLFLGGKMGPQTCGGVKW